MLRFGTISNVDASKGLVRVKFDEDGIVSGWIPFVQPKTLKDKHYSMPDVNEHVACMMDEHAENGIVVGAVYSKNTPPSFTDANKSGVHYENGDEMSFDRQARKLLEKIDTVEFSLEADGPTLKHGAETLKSILVELLDILIAHTHGTGVGPSTPPIEAPQLTANKTKVQSFFKA